jgi:hypothetical protein
MRLTGIPEAIVHADIIRVYLQLVPHVVAPALSDGYVDYEMVGKLVPVQL